MDFLKTKWVSTPTPIILKLSHYFGFCLILDSSIFKSENILTLYMNSVFEIGSNVPKYIMSLYVYSHAVKKCSYEKYGSKYPNKILRGVGNPKFRIRKYFTISSCFILFKKNNNC